MRRGTAALFLVPKLQAFSDEEVGSPLVLFDDMAEHALRIARVLKQPMGHVLLVGTSGAGKTTTLGSSRGSEVSRSSK